MSRARIARLGFFLLPLLLGARVWAASAAAPQTTHYGIYFQTSRIGSMVEHVVETTYEHKPAMRVDSDMSIHLVALGSAVDQKVSVVEVMTKDGHPLTSHFVMMSSGRTTTVDARFEAARVVCSVDAAGQKSAKEIPIPKGVKLMSDPESTGSGGAGGAGQGDDLKVGNKSLVWFFEPMTLSLQQVSVEVLKKEMRTVGGKQKPAFLLKTVNSLEGDSETWVDPKGELLEDNNSLGIRIVREDLEPVASSKTYEPPKDFAVQTSLKTEVKIDDARHAKALSLRISGVPDADLILFDQRQHVTERKKDGEGFDVTYLIQARDLPATSLPPAAPNARGDGLGDATFLDIGASDIRTQAHSLADGAPDRLEIARRIRAWVKGHMEKPANIGTPRSAVEIMRSRDGVCRDYATLFASLARAAGVPTRICSGIVYFEGAFYFHAWVECRLTDEADGWYAFDPTLNDDFVDATHVKFAQGGPSEMYGAVRVVGRIRAEVLPQSDTK